MRVHLVVVVALAACGSDEPTIMSRSDIWIPLPAGTRSDEPATHKLLSAVEHGGQLRWVYRNCMRSALVLTIPDADRDAVLARWSREPTWRHAVHKGLTDDVTRRSPDGSFVELLVLPTLDGVEGAALDPIELDLVLAYPDDLVVIALSGRCPEPS